MSRPPATTKSSRTSRAASALLLTTALFTSACMPAPRRAPYHFVVSEGFRGEARLELEVPGAAPLPLVDGARRIEFAADGTATTSDALEDGWGRDQWFERRASGLVPIEVGAAHGLTVLNPGDGTRTDYTTTPPTVQSYMVFEVVERP
jgi:hypothetical protein